MSIKQHLQNALANITAEQDRAIATEKEKAMREIVVPQHAEINQMRDNAIATITEKHNQRLAELQQAFQAERQQYIDASEKKKTEVTNSAVECATATVRLQYEKAIKTLEEQISKIEE